MTADAKLLADKIERDGLCTICDYHHDDDPKGPSPERDLIVEALRRYVQPRMTPELWGKLHIAIGCAREYPEFDGGSPIRAMLDDALVELNKLEPAMRASISLGGDSK